MIFQNLTVLLEGIDFSQIKCEKRKNRSKRKTKKIWCFILLESNYEFIVQYGSPEEITKLVKLLKNTKIIEQTRSGLVSMATGTDYIKK